MGKKYNSNKHNKPKPNPKYSNSPSNTNTSKINSISQQPSEPPIIDKKHGRYINLYKPNDTFWGIGIENETYLQFVNPYQIFSSDFTSKLKRERYSVDYYSNYNMEKMKIVLEDYFKPSKIYKFPLLYNAYSLTNTDIHGNHARVFKKNVLHKNPLFKVCIDKSLKDYDRYFKDNYGIDYVYDGDSIEFMTQKFYKANVKDSVKELKKIKEKYLEKINSFFRDKCPHLSLYGKLVYPYKNYGLVSFMSNKGNLSVCNNSTYHINLTLPTKLDSKGNISDETAFQIEHSNAIKALQFLLPFVVASYGSGDWLNQFDEGYFGGSLRCGMSRYISLGTYNSEQMKEGKLLDDFPAKDCKWYFKMKVENEYTKNYKLLDKIGYDINYKKFKNHGIEIRCLDWFPEKYLSDVLNFFILVLAFSQDGKRMCNFKREIELDIIDKNDGKEEIDFDICKHPFFNKLVYNAIKIGSKYILNENEIDNLYRIMDIKDNGDNKDNLNPKSSPKNIFYFLQNISDNLYNDYKDSWVVEKMSSGMKRPVFINYNELNKIQKY